MPTYLTGNPTYLPTVQPYQPNFQLYAGALQMKQTQYDQNRKKISDLYGSLLNSEMTRDSNIQARDEFFNTIDYEIKKLSSVDLSLQQNVDAASNLFTSLYQNKNIVKDMMWTKNYNNQVQRGEGFKSCINPDDCGGQYWDGGMQALQWKREEFRNVSDDEAMGFGDVEFTPYINVQAKAQKLMKEFGWKMSTPSFSEDGKWMIQTKNGKQLEGPLMAHFQNILGKDPAIQAYYKTKSYLDRKNWVASNTEQYGSAEAAEDAYHTEKNQQITDFLNGISDNSKYAKEQADKKVEDANKNIKDGKLERDDEIDEEINRLMGQSQSYEETANAADTHLTSMSNAASSNDSKLRGEALDNALGMFGLNDDISAAAQLLAYSDYEVTMKENPWALKEQEHKWRMAEIAEEDRLKDEDAKKALEGDSFLNQLFSGVVKTVTNLDPQAAYKMLRSDEIEDKNRLKSSSEMVLATTLAAAQDVAKKGGANSAQATDDAVLMVGEIIKQNKYNADYGGDSERVKQANALYKEWDKKSDREKAGWAKNFNADRYLSKFDGGSINKINKRSALTMYEDNANNKATRSYLRTVKGNLGNIIAEAQDAEAAMAQWKNIKEETGNKVASWLKTNGSPEYAKFWDHLIDNSGNIKTGQAFSLSYAEDKADYKQFGTDEEKLAHFKKTNRQKESNVKGTYETLKDAYSGAWGNMTESERGRYKNKEEFIDKSLIREVINKSQSKVKVKGADGKYQYIAVSDFFTKDGAIRGKYSKYAGKWSPGTANDSFWDHYKHAGSVYSGQDIGENSAGFWEKTWATAKDVGASAYYNIFDKSKVAFAPYRENEMELYREKAAQQAANIKTRNTAILREYKEAYNKANIFKGGNNYEGLHGSGSLTGQSLDQIVDYAAPASASVLREKSFLEDAFNGMRGKDVFFNFGGSADLLPGSNNANAEAFVKSLITDAISSKATEGSRPRWVGSFHTIAGGKQDWQSYTFTVNDPEWLKRWVGTESNQGPYYGMLGGSGGGGGAGSQYGQVTIYLNDKSANNIFHEQTKKSSLERRLGYAGSAPIAYGKYDDISKLTLSKNPNGPGYDVTGAVAVGRDPQTGKYIYDAISEQYYSSDADPNRIEQIFEPVLGNIAQRLGVTPVAGGYTPTIDGSMYNR